MKRSLLYSLAVATTLSVASVACTPTTTTTTASPSASAPSTAKPSPSPSASPSASPISSPTTAAKPPETPSAKPTESSSKPAEPKGDQAPDLVRVAIINNSGKSLTGVYMSAPSKKEWGQNELAEPLADREKADFEWKRSDYKGVDAGCVFDVGVEYGDGAITILDPIDLCKTPAINLK